MSSHRDQTDNENTTTSPKSPNNNAATTNTDSNSSPTGTNPRTNTQQLHQQSPIDETGTDQFDDNNNNNNANANVTTNADQVDQVEGDGGDDQAAGPEYEAGVRDVQFLLDALSMKAERPVMRLSQLSSSFFVLAFRQLFGYVPNGVNVNPTTSEDRVNNARAVIESLESKLNQSLDHITPELVAGHDELHISKLLRVFVDICTPRGGAGGTGGGTGLDDTNEENVSHTSQGQGGPQVMVRDWLTGLYGVNTSGEQQQGQQGGQQGQQQGGNVQQQHHQDPTSGAPTSYLHQAPATDFHHFYQRMGQYPHHQQPYHPLYGTQQQQQQQQAASASPPSGSGDQQQQQQQGAGAGGSTSSPSFGDGTNQANRRIRRVAALLSQRDVPRYQTHVCNRLIDSDGRLVRQFTGDGAKSTVGTAYAQRQSSAPSSIAKRPLPAMANARRDAKIERLRSEKFLQGAQDRAVREVVAQASREEVRMVGELKTQLHEQRMTFLSLDKLAKEKDERLREIYNDNVVSAVGAAKGKGMRLNLHRNAAELVRRERGLVEREKEECEGEIRMQFEMLRAKREAYLSHLSSWRVSVLKQDSREAQQQQQQQQQSHHQQQQQSQSQSPQRVAA